VTIAAALRARMDQTITVHATAGYNSRGDASWSTTAVTYEARVEAKTRLLKGALGRDQLATTTVYVGLSSTGAVPSIGQQDRVTLPDGTTPTLVRVDTLRDRTGVHHQVLYLE